MVRVVRAEDGVIYSRRLGQSGNMRNNGSASAQREPTTINRVSLACGVTSFLHFQPNVTHLPEKRSEKASFVTLE